MALAAANGNCMPSISLCALDTADLFVLSLENRTLLFMEVSIIFQINGISMGSYQYGARNALLKACSHSLLVCLRGTQSSEAQIS
jgi:hypothetical protein